MASLGCELLSGSRGSCQTSCKSGQVIKELIIWFHLGSHPGAPNFFLFGFMCNILWFQYCSNIPPFHHLCINTGSQLSSPLPVDCQLWPRPQHHHSGQDSRDCYRWCSRGHGRKYGKLREEHPGCLLQQSAKGIFIHIFSGVVWMDYNQLKKLDREGQKDSTE